MRWRVHSATRWLAWDGVFSRYLPGPAEARERALRRALLRRLEAGECARLGEVLLSISSLFGLFRVGASQIV